MNRVRIAKWAYFLSRSARRGTKHVANLALSAFFIKIYFLKLVLTIQSTLQLALFSIKTSENSLCFYYKKSQILKKGLNSKYRRQDEKKIFKRDFLDFGFSTGSDRGVEVCYTNQVQSVFCNALQLELLQSRSPLELRSID